MRQMTDPAEISAQFDGLRKQLTQVPAERILPMWQIFRSPLDYPGKFVVRRFDVAPGIPEPVPAAESAVCDTLEQAREAVPPFLTMLPRNPEDHPSVVEVWL